MADNKLNVSNSRINKHGKGSTVSQCNSTTLWGGDADGKTYYRDFTTTKKEAFVSLPTQDQSTPGVHKINYQKC